MPHNEIGFFQLDNLIKNRIPFSLLMIDVDLTAHYATMERRHIENFGISFNDSPIEQIFSEFRQRNIPADQAVVILCKDGIKSLELLIKLEDVGYINVFCITGGLTQLLKDKGL